MFKKALFLVMFILPAVSYAYDSETLVDTNNTSTSTSTVNTTNNSNSTSTNINTSTVNSTNTSTNNNNNVSTSTATSVNTNNNINSGEQTFNNNNVTTSTNTNNNINSGEQTFNNNNVNTSTNTNHNINSGTQTFNNNNLTTSNNNNINTNSSTSTSTNTNIQQGEMTNKNLNDSKIEQVVKQPPPTAIAPAMMSGGNNDLCTTGTSGAVQTQILGVSSGGTTRDMNCERLKNAKTLYDMGMKVAAVATLCQDRRVFDAMWNAGTPCPYEGQIGQVAKDLWLENTSKWPKAETEKTDDFYKKTSFGALLGIGVFKLLGF